MTSSLSFGKITNKPFTILLIDFDDTFLPTTSLLNLGYLKLMKDPHWEKKKEELKQARELLAPLTIELAKFLVLAREYGHICFVTNANTHDYIPLLVNIFYPSLIPLFDDQIKIISAVQNWEDMKSQPALKKGEDFYTKIKYQVFSELVREKISKNYDTISGQLKNRSLSSSSSSSNNKTEKSKGKKKRKRDPSLDTDDKDNARYLSRQLNIVCLGDAEYEHDAVHQLVHELRMITDPKVDVLLKTIKFASQPNVAELFEEIIYLIDSLPYMVAEEKSFHENLYPEDVYVVPIFENPS